MHAATISDTNTHMQTKNVRMRMELSKPVVRIILFACFPVHFCKYLIFYHTEIVYAFFRQNRGEYKHTHA